MNNKVAIGEVVSPSGFKCQFKIKSFTYQAGNSKADNIKAAAAGLKLSCTVCKSSMPDPKTYKQV